MKNLYARLQLTPDAAQSRVAERIASLRGTLPPDDERDCRVVLLEPSRRVVYDRNLAVLKDIARVRQRLSLTDTDLWRAARYPDLLGAAISQRDRQQDKVIDFLKQHSISVFLGIAFSIYLAFVFFTSEPRNASSPLPAAPAVRAAAPPRSVSPTQPPDPVSSLPLPKSGVVRKFGGWEGLAPLTIFAPQDGRHRLIKVQDAASGKKVLLLFVRDGENKKVRLPLGTYRIHVASGSNWYGTKLLFGRRTRVTELEGTFDFTLEGDQYVGHRIELILQRDGNLKEREIPLESFDDDSLESR